MATWNASGHSRSSSLVPIDGNKIAPNSSEDLTKSSSRGLRPLPASRDGSPHPHQRVPSIELHLSHSNQNLRYGLRDPSPGRHNSSPSPAIRSASSAKIPYSSQSPSFPPIYPSNSVSSPAIPTLYPSPNSYHVHNGQPPASIPTPGLYSAAPPSFAEDDILVPPPRIGEIGYDSSSSQPGNRAGSIPRGRSDSRGSGLPESRGTSPAQCSDGSRPTTPTEGKLSKKRGWISSRYRSRSQSASSNAQLPQAWVVSPNGQSPYDLSHLLKAQPVPELWDPNGSTFVHLFPQNTGLGPSFKVDSALVASSRVLCSLANVDYPAHRGRQSVSSEEQSSARYLQRHMRQVSLDVPSMASSPSVSRASSADGRSDGGQGGARMTGSTVDETTNEVHIYLSFRENTTTPGICLLLDDFERVVDVRNLFAFLEGQVFVGTTKRPSFFSILLGVAESLQHYEFSNFDGSSLGEIPTLNFINYTEDLRLRDVRSSREKTIEAIVLGERMKSWGLYNEGFVHGVGKWDDIVRLQSPIFSLISKVTHSRMEKASMDLHIRLKSMRGRLEDFTFPSLFAGVAASSAEAKHADFKSWRTSFAAMRKHTMAVYRTRYGSWPPNAKSKKNNFEESGLNRLLLQEVYQDFSDLYDMLVDRSSLTTRTTDMPSEHEVYSTNPRMNVLRKLMNEFDCSSPPVQPPIPFDVPLLPDLTSTRRDFESLPAKKQAKERGKRLKSDEITKALMQSYNRDSVKVTPFIEGFMAFERNSAHGKSIDEMIELRTGQWIFLYVVLQSLPLVVTDAPGLNWTQGVEYFLCEVPKGSPPWAREDNSRKVHYRAAGGSIVSLPPDVVDHGVEGIYRRSHAWKAAEKWTGREEIGPGFPPRTSSVGPVVNRKPLPQNFFDGAVSGYPAAPNFNPDGVPLSRSSSTERQSPRGSVAYGLEALPLPQGFVPGGFQNGSRSVSTPDPTKSFDDILGTAGGGAKKTK